MIPQRTRRSLLAGLVVTWVAACGPVARPVAPPEPSATTSGAAAATAPLAPSATASSAIPPAILVVGRAGADRWQLVDAATGEPSVSNADFSLPVGAPRSGWGRIVSATIDGDATIVRDEVVQPGFGGPELRLDGRWRLPTVGDDPVPVGRSLDGSTIVLVDADPPADAPTTRFAVVEHTFGGHSSTVGDADLRLVRIVELRGRFAYDALSRDGRILYVVEHLDPSAGGHYQVRAVDLPGGALRDGVIVDKANPDERMAGYPVAQARLDDGLVLTLYDGPEHPFVHALQTSDGWAVCIDLPAAPGADRSAWGLALGPTGRGVYAANGAAGVVAEIDPGRLAVSRTATLSTAAAAPAVLAKFGHGELGPVGRGVLVVPDGSGLLVASTDGVALVDTRDLHERARAVAGEAIDTLAASPDGTAAFGRTRDGRILAFDPASGRTFGAVRGGPWATLVAVAPW